MQVTRDWTERPHATAKKEITIENALRGIRGTKMQLHPGAAKFYADKGIK